MLFLKYDFIITATEIEQLIKTLSEEEKKSLALMTHAFVTWPTRSMNQVMDDMAAYDKGQ